MPGSTATIWALRRHLDIGLAQRAVIGLFMLIILSPGFAVMQSPRFRTAVGEIIMNPGQRAYQIEALRRSTPLWDKAVKVYSTALYHFGRSSNPAQAVVGRNGWVFLGDGQANSFSQSIHRRVLSDQELGYWVMSLGNQAKWLRRQGIPLVFIVAPSSGTIYPENLPAWTSRFLSRPSSFDRVLTAGANLPLIDVRPELKAAKSMAPTYSPLNSHWTDFGASVAWRKVAMRLKSILPGFEPFAADGQGTILHLEDIGNEFEGLAGIVAPNPWVVFQPKVPFPDFMIVGSDGSTRVVPGTTETGLLDLPRQTLNSKASNDLTAMILEDSMGTAISPFLQASFRRTIQLNHHYTQFPKDQINLVTAVRTYKPDVVIYVMTERYFDVPLGNPYYWYSVEAFDNLDGDQAMNWTRQDSSASKIAAQGDLTLASDAAFTWPPEATQASAHAVRVDLVGSGYGVVRLRCLSRGQKVEALEAYFAGENELYFNLPDVVDANTFTLAKFQSDSPALDLREIVLRYKENASSRLGAWPSEEGGPAIDFNGDVTLSQAEPVIIPASYKPRRLSITLEGAGTGTMYVGFRAGGKVVEKWHDFGAGPKTVQVELPPQIDNETVWLVRDTKLSSLKLIKLVVDRID